MSQTRKMLDSSFKTVENLRRIVAYFQTKNKSLEEENLKLRALLKDTEKEHEIVLGMLSRQTTSLSDIAHVVRCQECIELRADEHYTFGAQTCDCEDITHVCEECVKKFDAWENIDDGHYRCRVCNDVVIFP